MMAMRAPLADAIILDINMPAGSGEDTLRKVKMSTKTKALRGAGNRSLTE